MKKVLLSIFIIVIACTAYYWAFVRTEYLKRSCDYQARFEPEVFNTNDRAYYKHCLKGVLGWFE
jgi:hypothetical protein